MLFPKNTKKPYQNVWETGNNFKKKREFHLTTNVEALFCGLSKFSSNIMQCCIPKHPVLSITFTFYAQFQARISACIVHSAQYTVHPWITYWHFKFETDNWKASFCMYEWFLNVEPVNNPKPLSTYSSQDKHATLFHMKRYNFLKKTRVNKLGVTTQLVYGLWLGLRLKDSNNWTILNAQHTQSHIISQRHLCTNTELQDGTNWSILYGWKQPTFRSDTTCFCIHNFTCLPLEYMYIHLWHIGNVFGCMHLWPVNPRYSLEKISRGTRGTICKHVLQKLDSICIF